MNGQVHVDGSSADSARFSVPWCAVVWCFLSPACGQEHSAQPAAQPADQPKGGDDSERSQPVRVAGQVVPFRPQRAEFEAWARALFEGDNPFLGVGPVRQLRAYLAQPQLSMVQRLQAQAALANKLLEQGEEQEAVALLLATTTEAERVFGPQQAMQQLGYVYARLCVAWLRRAEVENCVLRHAAESCLFPLDGGGIHQAGESAQQALQLLLRYCELQPDNLTARWLLNVAVMAVGEYPDGLAPQTLIPPSAFASEYDIGRFEQAAGRLGVDAFSLCGGVACDDFDGDGRLDLYVGNESRAASDTQGSYPNQLFMNQGQLVFADGAAERGAGNDRFAKGVAAGDCDNDGDLDLYVSNVEENRLLANDGSGRFQDVAREAAVLGPRERSFATWFFDQDQDGWLDIFVAAFRADPGDLAAEALGRPHRAELPRLYRNLGSGSFEDVTVARGLARVLLPMGAAFGDLDNDGWQDLYLTTGDPSFETLMPNVMLRNDGGGRFQDVTVSGGFTRLPCEPFAY